MKIRTIVVLASLAALAACASAVIRQERKAAPAAGYTLEDVAKHSSESDCWFILGGKAYDVTAFIPHHPGGKAILEGCGKDATVLFRTRPMGSGKPHSIFARWRAAKYSIGAAASAK